MTKTKLNIRIAKCLFPDAKIKPLRKDGTESEIIIEVNGKRIGGIIDYCNSPNDLMPLIFEHGVAFGQISAIYSDTKYFL